MGNVRARFSIWLARLVTWAAGFSGIPWLVRLMRRMTGAQVTAAQMLAIRSAIREKVGSRLLVFGVGNDSAFWMSANRGGITAFLEDDQFWLQRVKRMTPGIDAFLVSYQTRIEQWEDLLKNPEQLNMDLPGGIGNRGWDVVFVDAPTGWGPGTTGRMKSIYLASQLCAEEGSVFVHDCERSVEQIFCDRFLKPANLVSEISAMDSGTLRHYRLRS